MSFSARSTSLGKFRSALKRSLLLEPSEAVIFDKIPDEVIDSVFKHNFKGNLSLAERILFNRYKDVETIDRPRLESEKKSIRNFNRASERIKKALDDSNETILFITDNDNDGSLSQAIIQEFLPLLSDDERSRVVVEYTRALGGVRGLNEATLDAIVESKRWAKDKKLLIITADNGINNRTEQEKIIKSYPKTSLLITDHHEPNDNVVLEGAGPRTLIFNPKNKPTEYFRRNNISGADTLGVVLSEVARQLKPKDSEEEVNQKNKGRPLLFDESRRLAINNITELGQWANLLDYANATIADMPLKTYTIERALELRPLLNVAPSMANLISEDFSTELLQELDVIAQKSANNKNVDTSWIKNSLTEVKALNMLAQRLLGVNDVINSIPAGMTRDKEYYAILADELTKEEPTYTSVNPNYIEQLRPVLFRLAAIDNKDKTFELLAHSMTAVYQDLRKIEKGILEKLRELRLLRSEERASSTILHAVAPEVTKIFNRRLLGKAYNRSNNGFLLTLSSVGNKSAEGSMRSLFDIDDIMDGKEEIEDLLGVSIEWAGHQRAAGFKVRAKEKTNIDDNTLSELNKWIDKKIHKLKEADKINQVSQIDIDFASVGLIAKINQAVKANLAGMRGIPALLSLSPQKDGALWVTDPKTTEQIELTD